SFTSWHLAACHCPHTTHSSLPAHTNRQAPHCPAELLEHRGVMEKEVSNNQYKEAQTHLTNHDTRGWGDCAALRTTTKVVVEEKTRNKLRGSRDA
ncbi:hypothetical protein K439DRAFT_1629532, partial [Ramaria rubella]